MLLATATTVEKRTPLVAGWAPGQLFPCGPVGGDQTVLFKHSRHRHSRDKLEHSDPFASGTLFLAHRTGPSCILHADSSLTSFPISQKYLWLKMLASRGPVNRTSVDPEPEGNVHIYGPCPTALELRCARTSRTNTKPTRRTRPRMLNANNDTTRSSFVHTFRTAEGPRWSSLECSSKQPRLQPSEATSLRARVGGNTAGR